MKTILIPTDFNTSSLNCVPSLCNQFKDQELAIIFVHVFKLSDDIGDLLMLSRRSKEYDYVKDDFYRIAEELKNEFHQIKSIKIEFLYGSTLAIFRNFLEAHSVNCVLNAADCSCSKLNKSSLDPFVLTGKSGLPTVSVLKTIKNETIKINTPLELELAEA
jgi:hypothetical protein